MKSDQIIDTAKTLRANVARWNAFEATILNVDAQLTSIHSRASLGVDTRLGAEFAAAKAAKELATDAIPPIRAETVSSLQVGMAAQDTAHARIMALHEAIDAEISRRVVDSAPADIRAGVDPTRSKQFISERSNRPDVSIVLPFFGPAHTDAELKSAVHEIASRLDIQAAELERASTVARKLGVAA